jgi:beta-barrel assembly-enhancing protease
MKMSSKFRVSSFKLLVLLAFLSMAVISLIGCSTVAEVATGIGQGAGVITPQQAASINKSAQAVEKTFQDITPEQEYYIGRSVAATVLTTYRPFDEKKANDYLNVLGQTLSQFSTKPETFGGYHFLLLNTDEINAFSAPGGLVMISRGMVRLCKNEGELAAVLAHEIGHVENQHGLRAIKKGRLTSALTTLALEAGKNLGGSDLAQVTEAFEGSITDITSTMMNSGYARTTEFQADKGAVDILKKSGYNPAALVGMLQEMQKRWVPNGPGFGHTHPEPSVRVAEIQKQIGAAAVASEPSIRINRFKEAMGGV